MLRRTPQDQQVHFSGLTLGSWHIFGDLAGASKCSNVVCKMIVTTRTRTTATILFISFYIHVLFPYATLQWLLSGR